MPFDQAPEAKLPPPTPEVRFQDTDNLEKLRIELQNLLKVPKINHRAVIDNAAKLYFETEGSNRSMSFEIKNSKPAIQITDPKTEKSFWVFPKPEELENYIVRGEAVSIIDTKDLEQTFEAQGDTFGFSRTVRNDVYEVTNPKLVGISAHEIFQFIQSANDELRQALSNLNLQVYAPHPGSLQIVIQGSKTGTEFLMVAASSYMDYRNELYYSRLKESRNDPTVTIPSATDLGKYITEEVLKELKIPKEDLPKIEEVILKIKQKFPGTLKIVIAGGVGNHGQLRISIYKEDKKPIFSRADLISKIKNQGFVNWFNDSIYKDPN